MPISVSILRKALFAGTLLLVACNSQNASAPSISTAAPVPSATSAAGLAAPSGTATSATAADGAANDGIAVPIDDAGAQRPAPPAGMPDGPAPVQGTDFTLIDTPEQPGGNKVQVVEVFGYGCPHCNNLQPYLTAWEKKLPTDVQMSYLPAAFGPGPAHCWDEFARGFYASLAMGVPLSRSHDAVFKAVWDQQRFTDDCKVIPSIYADLGLDPKVFASTMQSFAISAKIGNAHDQVMRWGVDGTPTIIVDGKYKVPAATPAAMLHTVDWLIAQQRAARAKH